MNQKLIHFIIFIAIHTQTQAFQLTKEQERNVYVFQPFPSGILDSSSICNEGQTSSLATFILNDKHYVAMSLTLCGVYIYDITDITNPSVEFNDYLNKEGKTLGVTMSHQTKYVWVTHSTGNFYGINVEQIPFKILITGSSNENLLIYNIFPWINNNDILFLACNNQFQIFDWRDKRNGLKHMQSIDIKTVTSNRIEFIRNNQYALVGTLLLGVQFYQVNNGNAIDKMTFKQVCVLKPTFFDIQDYRVIDDNTIAMMMVYTGVYLLSMKNFFDKNGQICDETSFSLLSQTPIQGQGGNIYLSNDKKYLYTQFRSVGIKIYDVSQSTLQIIQEIKVIQNSKDIILNEKEDLIFYTNGQSLQIFKRTLPNFNREVPNLLLNTYQIQQFNWFKEFAFGSFDFECIWREDLKQVMISRQTLGLLLLKYSGQGVLEENTSVYRGNELFQVTQIGFLDDGVTGYVSVSNGFSIMNFSKISSPVVLKENVTMGSKIVQFGFFKLFKTQKLGVVCNKVNGLIFSVKDPQNPVIVGVIDTMAFTLGEVTLHYLELNKKEDIAFCLLSTYGVIVTDLSDPSKPLFLSKYFTDGASDIKLTSDEKYVVIAANYNGIIIAEFTKEKQLVFVSKVQSNGNSFRLLIFEGDQFILVTSYEDPMISLISIGDIKNPRVIQKIGNKRLAGYFQMCTNQDRSELFVTGQYYLFHLNLKTSLILHTQMYLLISQENSNEYIRQALEQGSSLKVGQKIELHLVPIYQTQDIKLSQAFYYDEFVLQDLPPWMTFYPSESIMSLNISKDSLKKNNKGEFIDTITQIIFLTYSSLSKSAFVNTYLNITYDDSTSIYDACQIEGYLDFQGFIMETYSPLKQFNLGAKEDSYLLKWLSKKNLVKQFIQYILNLNIVNYTTQLKITHSLYVDLKNSEQYISTLQDSVEIKMTILENISRKESIQSNKARFVKKNYSGVLVLISDKKDEIQIEGSLKNINSVLQGGIKFSIDEEKVSPNIIDIRITISDSVNYNYENKVSFKSLPFLQQQSLIKLSKESDLQSDIYQKYPKGEIYIEESFQYQVSQDIFLSKDESQLQYNAKLKLGSEFQEIPKDYWLQFSPTDRIFTGTPTRSKFNEEIVIQVNATDGYSYQMDQFMIIPNKIPFTYAFQLAVQILGPIFGVLGLYRYKHIIYNTFFKDQYVYSKDIAYVGEFYRKQIIITDYQLSQAFKIWKFFLDQIGKDNIRNQLKMEIQRQGEQNYISKDSEQPNYYQSQFQDEIFKKIYPFGVNQDDVQVVDKKLQNVIQFNTQNILLEESKQTGQNQINNNEIIEDKNNLQIEKSQYYLEKSQIKSQVSVQRLESSIIIRGSNLKNKIQNIIKQMNFKQNKNSFKLPTNLQSIFKSDGTINFQQIIKFIIQQSNLIPNNKRDISLDDLKQLENPNSIITQAFYCLLVEYLLNLSPTTKSIFDCLKQLAVGSFKEIDWYKAYIRIEPQFNEVHINPYPIFIIYKPTLHSALTEIFRQIDIQKNNKKQKIKKLIPFSLVLIEECLKAKAYGFSFQPHKFIQATRGESLHTYKYMINSVKAYERNNGIKCCYNLYEKLDLHYQSKGLTDNDKLPMWIQGIDLINGAILFGGIPEKKDIGSIIIKIFNQQQYILRSFEIQILQKQTEQDNQITKQFLNPNITEKKDITISINENTQSDIHETSQSIHKKKKSLDFNKKQQFSHRRSLKVNSSIGGILSNRMLNSTSDQIIEEKLENELQTQTLLDESPVLRHLEQQNNKQFRILQKQDSFQNEEQTINTPQENTFFLDLPDKRCRIQNKASLKKPIQTDDSILSLQD